MIGWVAIPAAPFALLPIVPPELRWILFIWLPFGFLIWAFLSRKLLVLKKYRCPQCGTDTAMIHVEETADSGIVYLRCPCGYQERSRSAGWGGNSGG